MIVPMFGGFGLLFVLLYLKESGPEVVVVANPTSLYVVSRTGLRFTPKEIVVPWSEARLLIDLQTVTQKGITTHWVGLKRQRRDNNPQNYDEKGRVKKAGKQRLHWKTSKGYERIRRRKAEKERKLAADAKRAWSQRSARAWR